MRPVAIVALALFAACSTGDAPDPKVKNWLPTAGGAWFRCSPDRGWRPAPVATDINCDDDGDLVCPRGDCRVAHRRIEDKLWAADLQWWEIGRTHPVFLSRFEIYRVYPVDPQGWRQPPPAPAVPSKR